jgi:hypothetical protein
MKVFLPVFLLFLVFGVGLDFTMILWAMGLKMTVSATIQTYNEAKYEQSDFEEKESEEKTDHKVKKDKRKK